jgi:hypothetical protein
MILQIIHFLIKKIVNKIDSQKDFKTS